MFYPSAMGASTLTIKLSIAFPKIISWCLEGEGTRAMDKGRRKNKMTTELNAENNNSIHARRWHIIEWDI